MKAVLTIFNSKRDTYGNVYYALRLHSHGGEPIQGKIQPDNVDTRDCREVLDWYIERQELPIRQFNALTKGWPYFGCGWPEIRAAILARLNAPAPVPELAYRPLVCGTRRTARKGPNDYRVVCASCDGGGTVKHATHDSAARAAIRDSSKPCPCKPSCGAA